MSFFFCIPRALVQQSRLMLLAVRLLLFVAGGSHERLHCYVAAGDAFNRASVHGVTVEIAVSVSVLVNPAVIHGSCRPNQKGSGAKLNFE